MALLARASTALVFCSHELLLGTSLVLHVLCSKRDWSVITKKDEKDHGVLWSRQNELVSAKVGIVVDLYAKVTCRNSMSFSNLLVSHCILQHCKRKTVTTLVKEHFLLLNEHGKQQPTSVNMSCCLLEKRCMWWERSNSTLPAKKLRVTLATVSSSNLVLSTEAFLHLFTLPVSPPEVIPKMKCILQRWKQYFGDLLNVCSATSKTANLPPWCQLEEQNKEERCCCWSWHYSN